jgi:hypothetical protein
VRGDYTRTLALTRLLLLLAPLRAFVAPAFVAGRDLVFFFHFRILLAGRDLVLKSTLNLSFVGLMINPPHSSLV